MLSICAATARRHLVELFGHQHRREFDNMGFHAEVFQRAGRFQSEQAAADYRAAFAAAAQDSMALRSSIVR
nr:hypothetical protein GCM10025699_38530 [Microbacterium flavescens]